jgi:antitoxin MazE
MRVYVRKWGNSLALRIPKAVAQDVGVRAGSVLDVAVSRGKIVAAPAVPERVRLKDLLRRVTKKNLHAELESGPPVGREAW